ncbi:MAG: helix-turn-helix domain-containing protein, partial [Blastocatellia bacterium]
MELKDYVRGVMERKNLSAPKVAKRSGGGITASYVTKILRGETKRPSAEKLHWLATGLDEPDKDVFRAAGVMPADTEEWTGKSAARA